MRYHHTPIRTATTQNSDASEGWGDAQQQNPQFLQGGWQRGMATGAELSSALQSWAQHHHRVQPPCSLLFTQNVLKTYVHTEICTHKLTAPLLSTTKTWAHLRSSSIWYSHTTEYYSAIKRNDPSSHETGRKLIHTYLLLQLYCCNCWESAT